MKRRVSLSEAEELARAIGGAIGEVTSGTGWGFALALFTFGEEGFSTYISNCKRQDTIKALKELVEKIEKYPEASFKRKP